MGKVLIKFKYDMNDADYIFGIHAMEKELWEKWEKIYKYADNVSKSHNYEDMERTPDEFFQNLKVTEITEEEYETLKKLGLIGFGESLPQAYFEELGEEVQPEAPSYKLGYVSMATNKYVDFEDEIMTYIEEGRNNDR